MAEQVLVQFRTDKSLKQEVTEIYEALGMDLPTAFRMFMKRSILAKGLPFEARLPELSVTRSQVRTAFLELRQQAQVIPELSLDEINDEITAARIQQED